MGSTFKWMHFILSHRLSKFLHVILEDKCIFCCTRFYHFLTCAYKCSHIKTPVEDQRKKSVTQRTKKKTCPVLYLRSHANNQGWKFQRTDPTKWQFQSSHPISLSDSMAELGLVFLCHLIYWRPKNRTFELP